MNLSHHIVAATRDTPLTKTSNVNAPPHSINAPIAAQHAFYAPRAVTKQVRESIHNIVHVSTCYYAPTVQASIYAVLSLCTSSSSSFFAVSYRLPRNAYTPQLLQVTSCGSRSLRSHLRLLNRFSPGSSSISISLPYRLVKWSTSCCTSQGE